MFTIVYLLLAAQTEGRTYADARSAYHEQLRVLGSCVTGAMEPLRTSAEAPASIADLALASCSLQHQALNRAVSEMQRAEGRDPRSPQARAEINQAEDQLRQALVRELMRARRTAE